jgi:hypothetical protein
VKNMEPKFPLYLILRVNRQYFVMFVILFVREQTSLQMHNEAVPTPEVIWHRMK